MVAVKAGRAYAVLVAGQPLGRALLIVAWRIFVKVAFVVPNSGS